MQICHRDLSPENMIILDNKSLVIDFGMCLRIPHSHSGMHLITPQLPCGKLVCVTSESSSLALSWCDNSNWICTTTCFTATHGSRIIEKTSVWWTCRRHLGRYVSQIIWFIFHCTEMSCSSLRLTWPIWFPQWGLSYSSCWLENDFKILLLLIGLLIAWIYQ